MSANQTPKEGEDILAEATTALEMTQGVRDDGCEANDATSKLMFAFHALVAVLLGDRRVDPQRLIRVIEEWREDGGVQSICCLCGARGAGNYPSGWRIEPVYGHAALRRTVVGEHPICPACQEQR